MSRPTPELRRAAREARAAGARRDAAVAAGDLAGAWRAHREFEMRYGALARAVRAACAARREGRARPSGARRGGRDLVVVDVPADRLEFGQDRPKSVPGGAWARPVWALGIDDALKFTAARYAALTEAVACGGGVKGVDLMAIRVDGGGHGRAPEMRLLRMAGQLAAAHRALEDCAGLSALRGHAADRRIALPARRLVDLVAVEGFTLCQVLGRHGWPRTGRNQDTVRDLLVAGLDAIAREWSGGAVVGHDKIYALRARCGGASVIGPQDSA